MPMITINGITVDPIHQEPSLMAAKMIQETAANSNYIIIQTKGPLTRAQKQELADKGAQILEYAPENAYIAEYHPSNLNPIRQLPYVDWANVYLKEFKISPSLIRLSQPKAPIHNLMEVSLHHDQTLDTTPRSIDVVLHQGVNAEAVKEKIAAASRIDPQSIEMDGDRARLIVQMRFLSELAAIDEVHHIEEVVPYKLHNNIARQILHVELQTGNQQFEGEGQVVAVADTGFDLGDEKNVHPAFKGRVKKLYALGRMTANDPAGHGTHVAGSILGDGTSAKLGMKIRGTAPQASLVLQSVLDYMGGLGGLPRNLKVLFQKPYEADGARIHSNSWGSTQGNGIYNSNCRDLDAFVWEHRDMVICFAAGNEGQDPDADGHINTMSVTPPGTAKNCITVGACENMRPDFTRTYGSAFNYPMTPIAEDKMADNPEGIAAFSSRGLTRDGRIKPDIVAPGTYILSARSRATQDTGWDMSGDPLYYYMGGTSMATPLVSGCIAVVREYLAKERNSPNPSAALVKALLINGARDITGQYVPTEAGEIPNGAEGFGRVDMQATIGPFTDGVSYMLKDEGNALDTGDEERQTVGIGPEVQRLKVTLVWTDPPGEALQNDLDLIVRAPGGKERHGNMPPHEVGFDRINNVEQVIWEGIPAGSVEVIVRAYRIAQQPQPYALVIRTD